MNCIQPFLKYFKIILSFFLKLFDAKRSVKSVKLLSLSTKSIKPIQKYPHIIESYASVLKLFVFMFLCYDVFNTKTIKISIVIIRFIQSNPMSSNIRIVIKIYYICLMLYFQN